MRRNRFITIALFLMPALVICLFTIVLPMIEGFRISLTDSSLGRRGEFIGIDNYAQLLRSADFSATIVRTLAYVFFAVFITIVLGYLTALLLDTVRFGKSVLRSLVTIPWATPSVAVALVLVWIFNNQYGVSSRIFNAITGQTTRWLDNPDLAFILIVGFSVWLTFPFASIVILANLQSVPQDLYEAVLVDGGGAWHRLRYVTIPHSLSAVMIVTLFLSMWALRRFEIIWLTTKGGPTGTTETLSVAVYRIAFQQGRLGIAAAYGVANLVVAALVVVAFGLVNRAYVKRFA